MKCLSVEAMNLFLAITGLDIEPYKNHYVVTSNVPAYYTYEGVKGFCLIQEEDKDE